MFNSLLPINGTTTEQAIEAATARIEATPVIGGTLWQVQNCPERLLPWLAWALSADSWDSAWPEDIKRAVLARAVEVHRLKGTRGAVQSALDALGMSADISEWFEHGGAPYTFRIDVFADDVFNAGFNVDNKLFNLIERRLQTVKPVRAHYELRVGESFRANTYARTAVLGRYRDEAPRTPEPRSSVAEVGFVSRNLVRLTDHHSAEHMPAPRAARAAVTAGVRSNIRARLIHRVRHDVLRHALK